LSYKVFEERFVMVVKVVQFKHLIKTYKE